MSPARPILYVLNSAHTAGANRSLTTLLTRLDRGRWRPLAVLPARGPMEARLRELDVPAVRLPLPSLGRMQAAPLLARLKAAGRNGVNLTRLAALVEREGVRLIHTNSIFPLGGALAARLLDVPHVWHLREGLDLPEYDLRFGRRLSRLLFALLSDRVICISQYVRRVSLPDWARARAVVIPNALEAASPPPASASHGSRGEVGPRIGCLGVISSQKRTLIFVEAAALIASALPGARFIVAGRATSGEEDLLARCRARVTALGLDSQFEWPGFVEDPTRLYARLDLLIHPGVHEGFGRVVMEAMAYGIPVVGVASGALPELIEDGLTGRLVPPDSPAELAAAALDCLADPGRRERMGEQARHLALERFAPGRHVRAVCAVYERLLGMPGT